MRSEVSWAQSLTLHELLALGTRLGKSEASQALGLLGSPSPCSPEQQGAQSTPRGERENWHFSKQLSNGRRLPRRTWPPASLGSVSHGCRPGEGAVGDWSLATPKQTTRPSGPFPRRPLTPQPLFPVLSLRDLFPPRPGPRLLSRGHQRLWGPREAWRKPPRIWCSWTRLPGPRFPRTLGGWGLPWALRGLGRK